MVARDVPGKEAKALDDDGRVDKEEMHLQEGEECLLKVESYQLNIT